MKQESGTLEKQRLDQYINKLTNQKSSYDELMTKLQSNFLNQAELQIKDRFAKLKTEFEKLKKNTQKQLLTLKYCLQHPEQKGNLFALFNQIDQKIYFNTNIIQSTHFKLFFPYPSNFSMEDDVNSKKITLYENYLSQILPIFKSQNIRKYCKKQSEAVDKIMTIYQKLFDNAKQSIYCTQVKMKKVFEEGICEVGQYKHVQNLSLSLTNEKGLMKNQHYHQIVNSLLPNRFFLRKIDLKIMDMQFSQQKCDILRKRLSNQFSNLKNMNIQNYYKECKLGIFQDFNWQPYRKKVHINSGVW